MAAVPTEEEFNAASAAELVQLVYDSHGIPTEITIRDENYTLDSVDRNFALALAERLLHLAQSLPDSPRILRRASDIDEHLRALDN